MNIKDNFGNFLRLNEFKENVITLIESKIGLLKIDFQEKLEDVVVKVIYGTVMIVLSFVVIIFLSILGAILLNHWLKSELMGFLLVGGFYAVFLFIWIRAKNQVNNKIKKVAEKITESQLENIPKNI